MTANDFVLAFTAIVIGLGVTDLLTSFHKLLRAGSLVKWDVLTPAYALFALFSLIVFWWWQFGYPPPGSRITIFEYLPVFVFLALSFLMAASALPDDVPAEGLDLGQFYQKTVRHRFGILAASFAGNIVALLWIMAKSSTFYWRDLLILVASLLLVLACIRWRARWFHGVVILLIFAETVSGAWALRVGS